MSKHFFIIFASIYHVPLNIFSSDHHNFNVVKEISKKKDKKEEPKKVFWGSSKIFKDIS